MKQVIFAISLLAMASLTGCLTDDESSVDDETDTTSDTTEDNTDTTQDDTDTTDDTKDDELIDPVGSSGGYSPPDKANITVDSGGDTSWVAKDGKRITTSCLDTERYSIVVYDTDDRIIYLANEDDDYGASYCGYESITIDVTLGPEPVKISMDTKFEGDGYINYLWIVTF